VLLETTTSCFTQILFFWRNLSSRGSSFSA